MSPTTARDRARRHAERGHLCSCGKIVHGNGAKYQHREMHRRAEDGHRYVRLEHYRELFPDYVGGPSDRRVRGPREQGR